MNGSAKRQNTSYPDRDDCTTGGKRSGIGAGSGCERTEWVDEAAEPDEEPGFATQLRSDLPASDTRHVLSVFAGDLARLPAAIVAAAAASDAVGLRRAAHALAGAAGAVGADRLEAASRAAMSDPSDASDRLATHASAVEAAAAATGRALARVLAELSASPA